MKILKSGVCALALMATGAIAAPAMAQQSAISLHAGSLEVPVNKSQVVTADRPILKAMIGNAEVADVLPISDRSVYVLGKQFGTTSLTLYDRNNRVIAVMDVAVGPDVDGLRRQIGQLIPGQPIEAQLSNGSVLLTGMVSDTGAAARAAQLAKAFAGDKVINLVTMGSSQQVMLEVKFAEIDRNLGEKLGVSGFGVSRGGSFGGALGANTGFTPGSSTRTTKATIGTGGTIGGNHTGEHRPATPAGGDQRFLRRVQQVVPAGQHQH
jgi:pilus assembly protein CpaC